MPIGGAHDGEPTVARWDWGRPRVGIGRPVLSRIGIAAPIPDARAGPDERRHEQSVGPAWRGADAGQMLKNA